MVASAWVLTVELALCAVVAFATREFHIGLGNSWLFPAAYAYPAYVYVATVFRLSRCEAKRVRIRWLALLHLILTMSAIAWMAVVATGSRTAGLIVLAVALVVSLSMFGEMLIRRK
jgi:hypothetical protein